MKYKPKNNSNTQSNNICVSNQYYKYVGQRENGNDFLKGMGVEF